MRNGTIYMIGGGEQSPIAPLFCAFAEYVHYSAGLIGSTAEHGRLDPPLLMALDEVTQICPVPLNSWVGDSGGKGIMLLAVAHSRAQLEGRWGQHGAATIWDCCGVKMFLGGMTDAKTLDAVGALYGRIPVKDRDGQYRPAPVLPAELLHQLPDSRAIIVRRNMAPVIVRSAESLAPPRRPQSSPPQPDTRTARPLPTSTTRCWRPPLTCPSPAQTSPGWQRQRPPARTEAADDNHRARSPSSPRISPSSASASAAFSRPPITAAAQLDQKLDHAIAGNRSPAHPRRPGSSTTPASMTRSSPACGSGSTACCIPEYGPYVTWLRPCWPSHRPVLWELSVAWAHWRLTYDRPKPSLADAVFFHDRLLPGVCARLEPLMSGCGGNGRCRLDR